MEVIKVRVAQIVDETPNIKSFRLVQLSGLPFEPYRPGSHIDVTGPTGLTRQYSIVSPAHEREHRIIAVKREEASRGGSVAMHELQAGDVLEIGAPRTLLTVKPGADRHLLVAGGIGVTPLLSMAHHLADIGQQFELHYFARSREEAAFVDLLQDRSGFGDRVHFHFDTPLGSQPARLVQAIKALTRQSHVYVCGPAPFMDWITSLNAPRVGEDHVHVEHFQSAAPEDTSTDQPFEIELDTGELCEVAADESIVEALRDNGIRVETGCQEGVCGTCVARVIEGIPDHRDTYLPRTGPSANTQMAICVSRAKTPRLVISLE